MTQVCCSACRVRLGRQRAGIPTTCPRCGQPLVLRRAERAVGYRLVRTDAPDGAPSGFVLPPLLTAPHEPRE